MQNTDSFSRAFSVAIIGVSGYANTHYSFLLSLAKEGRIKFAAATVINQEEEAEKCAELRALGCELFTDYEAMFAAYRGKLDLCFIPTGIQWHEPMASAAMRSGANVLIEKPAAATIQEVHSLQACERETGKFCAVGFQHIYSPEVQEIKRRICSGEFGKILTVKGRTLWPRFESYYARNNWAGHIKANGRWVLDSPFNNAVAHQLNLIAFFAGDTFETSAGIAEVTAELYRTRNIENADTACIRVKTNHGTPLLFYCSHSPEETLNPKVVIRLEKATITWAYEGSTIEYHGAEPEKLEAPDHAALRESLVHALFRRIEDSSAFICSLNIAKAHTLCVNGAQESSPIYSLDSKLIRYTEQDGSACPMIIGFNTLVEECFAKELLFSEFGIWWARPGRSVDMQNYTVFQGNPNWKH